MILRSLSSERFAEVFAASARKARETYFHRHRIKAPKHSAVGLKIGRKTEARTKALFEALAEREDEEMSEEILRTWLLAKRSLLAATLDHLGIAHTDGLTDSDDVKKIEKLSGSELKTLVAHLQAQNVAPIEDIAIYLKYMGAEQVDEAIAA
jgi:hypothetical protein